MFEIDEGVLVDTVNALNKALMHLEDCYEFMGTFEHEHLGRTKQFMNDKESSMKHARDAIQGLESRLEEEGYQKTEDTGRYLQEDEGVFHCEGDGTWYDNWIRLIIDCYKSGMTREEIEEGLDLEANGFIYYTEFYR
ncbi:hypothetical protein COJ90_21065 [Priestia megaterium]|uniref:hypothetical protein n=1 Tax=Priestia megaterium TaxID=1404 RepID=UPI000BF78AC5|nr:hypothetical protein [Priestia megaterium]PFP09206.1 hypothetical protein COJ90_21065 [Priestia megaterium]